MSGADILNSPVRVNERSRTVYFFDGYVSVEIISGTEEQQMATLALVGQAQAMGKVLMRRLLRHGAAMGRPCACEECAEARAVLRDAGLMSGVGEKVEL